MQVRPVRLIHVGPVRLGRPPRTAARLDARAREELIRAATHTWTRIIETAVDAQVDFVLLNGTPFDSGQGSAWAETQFEQGLEQLRDAAINCVAIPESGEAHTAWNAFDALVEILEPGRTETLPITDATGDLCARLGNVTPQRTDDALTEFVRLGVHTHDATFPSTSEELPRGFDYVIAGSSARWKSRGDERSHSLHLSAPQPLTRDEPGAPGCLLAEFHSHGTWNVERRPVGPVRFLNRHLAVTDETSLDDLCLEMQSDLDRVDAAPADRLWLIRWELRGSARWAARIDADGGNELERAWRTAFANRPDDLHILHEFSAHWPSFPRGSTASMGDLSERLDGGNALRLPRDAWRGALAPLFDHDPDAERLVATIVERVSEEQVADQARSILTQAAHRHAAGEDVR